MYGKLKIHCCITSWIDSPILNGKNNLVEDIETSVYYHLHPLPIGMFIHVHVCGCNMNAVEIHEVRYIVSFSVLVSKILACNVVFLSHSMNGR